MEFAYEIFYALYRVVWKARSPSYQLVVGTTLLVVGTIAWVVGTTSIYHLPVK